MSIIDGIGVSPFTEAKQKSFRDILSLHLRISKTIIKKYSLTDYCYYDLTAGCGYNPREPDQPGSPLIFMDQIDNEISRFVHSYFFEKEKKSFDSLCGLLGMNKIQVCEYCEKRQCDLSFFDKGIIANSDFKVLGDSSCVILHSCPKPLGLLYCDQSGDVPPIDFFEKLSFFEWTKKIDFLFYLSATNIKRAKVAFSQFSLKEFIDRIDKKEWIIRGPQGPFQWTFLLGTNWNAFPEYQKQGFYKKDSPEGRAIFDIVNWTEKERKQLNGQQSFI